MLYVIFPTKVFIVLLRHHHIIACGIMALMVRLASRIP